MCTDKFAVIGKYFGFISGSKRDVALKTIEAIRGMIADLDISTSLKELGVPEAQLSTLAKECVEKYPRPYNVIKLDIPKAEKLYKYMWEGTIW